MFVIIALRHHHWGHKNCGEQFLPADFVAVRSLVASVVSTPGGQSLDSELGYIEAKE